VATGRGKPVALDGAVGESQALEALWAPDSAALAITLGSGTEADPARVVVYRAEQGRWARLDLSTLLSAETGIRCGEVERHADLAALAWSDGSSRLVVARAGPRAVGCPPPRPAEVWAVALPQAEIAARFTPLESRGRWAKAMGEGLRAWFPDR
jgi:hypothetical protein